MKKILFLGSDFYTIDAVKEARKMGLYVITADYLDSTPTKSISDESWLISTTDIEGLTEKCRQAKVSGVFCGASDFNVGNSRLLCKNLNLPLYCSSDYAWKVSRNKYLFKKICMEENVSVAMDYSDLDITKEDDLNKIEYPVVVKPVDLSGNRGMSFCHNKEELLNAYSYAKSLTKENNIVIEKMLQGTEHNAYYAIADGEIRLVSLNELNHDPSQPSNIYTFGRTISRYLPQYLEEINDNLIKVFKKIGCKEGVVWVDTMRDERTGKFYVLEMGYRLAASISSSPLLEKVSGFNAIRWMLECSIGKKHTIDDLPASIAHGKKCTAAAIHMFSKKETVISKIEGLEEIKTIPDITVEMPKMVGTSVRKLATIALICVYAEDCNKLVEKLKKINDLFKVYDEEESILIYYTDYCHIIDTYNESLQA